MTEAQSKTWRFFFAIALIAPTVVWLILFRFLPQSDSEKREKAPAPTVSIANYENISEEVTAWYNDRVPFRDALVSLDSYGIYRIFHEAGQDHVVVGKGNWLFYDRADDGEVVADYKGLSVFAQPHKEAGMANIAIAADRLALQGRSLAVLIVPEKPHVYADRMPDYIFGPGPSRAADFTNYVKTMIDVPIVYPQAELLAYKEENPEQDLYFHYDTHWNSLGAYIGTRSLLTELGMDSTAIWELSIEEEDDSCYDLAKLLSIDAFVHDDVGYRITDPNAGNLTVDSDDDDMWKVMHYTAEGENVDPRTVLVIRDSFGVQMAPFLAEHFSETYLIHRGNYFAKLEGGENPIEELDADLVIYEMSERYLGSRILDLSVL